MTVTLGISAFYHDAAAAIVRDGRIIAAAQEERFTRIKGDASFPMNAITYCLEEARVSPKDLTAIAYYDKPARTFDRLLSSLTASAPSSLPLLKALTREWPHQKTRVSSVIHESLGCRAPLYFLPHHLSHAAAAYYPSRFEEAAILTIDGVGEWATASIGHGKEKRIELMREMHFPDSLGLLYSAFTWFCGFKINSGEYKLMGLAPYGRPIYLDVIHRHLAELRDDGSLKLNMEHFAFLGSATIVRDSFGELFGGGRRMPESMITRREMDLAASIQAFTQEAVMRMAHHAQQLTGSRKLCLAGGVALNCVANGHLLRRGWFDELFIQPAAGDAGSALGAALAVEYNLHDQPRATPASQRDAMQGAYLGPAWRTDEVSTYLDSRAIPYRLLREDEKASVIAKALADQKVVGFFNGRMEFGPRSLGARSILGDPRHPDTQKTLNLRIKFRESFRPFAPAVLAEDTGEYFDLSADSPYMLLVAPVHEHRRKPRTQDAPDTEDLLAAVSQQRSDLPAITHWDYSARVQTVHDDTNPLFAAVLRAFKALTGVSVLVNTSFNVRGEPIVCSPHDAYQCFMRTDMDYLYLEGCWLEKTAQPNQHRYTKGEMALD
jgi:carbamoyltransferase